MLPHVVDDRLAGIVDQNLHDFELVEWIGSSVGNCLEQGGANRLAVRSDDRLR